MFTRLLATLLLIVLTAGVKRSSLHLHSRLLTPSRDSEAGQMMADLKSSIYNIESGLDLPGPGWHVTRATISNFKSFHGSYPRYYRGSAQHQAGTTILLLLSTGIIQIRVSCNSPAHSGSGENKDIQPQTATNTTRSISLTVSQS